MKLGVAGVLGRMGRTLAEVIPSVGGVTLSACSVQHKHEVAEAEALLSQLGRTGVLVTTDPKELAEACEAVIDFTTPEASLSVAAHAGIHIIGTTGFSEAELTRLMECGKRARIVRSGNFSIGVNVLAKLVEQAASMLGKEYDIEVYEMHHRHKVDAPSGTALLLGEAAAAGRGVRLNEAKRFYAEGRIGAREEGSIGFSVARGGGVIGEHSVTFAGEAEAISLSHRAFSRAIYAHGAIRAAAWAARQAPGLYSMQDVVS